MIVLLSVYWVLNVGYEFDYSHAIVRVTFLRWPASVHESTGAWRRQERYNTRASTSKRGKRKSRTLPSSPPFAENSSLLAERAVRGMRAESVKKKNLYIYIYIYIPTYIHTYIYIEREREGEREREWDIDVPCSWGGCDSRMTCVCVCVLRHVDCPPWRIRMADITRNSRWNKNWLRVVVPRSPTKRVKWWAWDYDIKQLLFYKINLLNLMKRKGSLLKKKNTSSLCASNFW